MNKLKDITPENYIINRDKQILKTLNITFEQINDLFNKIKLHFRDNNLEKYNKLIFGELEVKCEIDSKIYCDYCGKIIDQVFWHLTKNKNIKSKYLCIDELFMHLVEDHNFFLGKSPQIIIDFFNMRRDLDYKTETISYYKMNNVKSEKINWIKRKQNIFSKNYTPRLSISTEQNIVIISWDCVNIPTNLKLNNNTFAYIPKNTRKTKGVAKYTLYTYCTQSEIDKKWLK